MTQIFRNKLILLLILFLILKSSVGYCTTERNILTISLSSNNELLVERSIVKIDSLKDIIKLFITNPNNEDDKCEKRERTIDYFGAVHVPIGVISIQCQRNTSYEFFIQVQNEIEKAFNELWNEVALKYFGKEFNLISKRKQKAIQKYIPQIISEAEPN